MVVHTTTEALLIKRVDHESFWQSVTGSLEWHESPSQAAVRELEEETSITEIALRSTGIRRSYEIAEAWRSRYQPGVTRNYETLYYCQLDHPKNITLNPDEHIDYVWMPIAEAQHNVYSWSNRLALNALICDS